MDTRWFGVPARIRETLTYLIIYVGAIAILFLFVIIMINIKLVHLVQRTTVNALRVSRREYPERASLEAVKGTETNSYPLAFILASIFFVSLELLSVMGPFFLWEKRVISVKFFDFLNLSVFNHNFYSLTNNVLITLLDNSSWDTAFRQFDQILSVGIVLYTTYAILIVMLSVILLLAIIGPILLTFRPGYSND